MSRLPGVLAIVFLFNVSVLAQEKAVIAPEQILNFTVERDNANAAEKFTITLNTANDTPGLPLNRGPNILVTPYYWDEVAKKTIPIPLTDGTAAMKVVLPENYLEKPTLELTATLDHARLKTPKDGHFEVFYEASLTAPGETTPYQVMPSAVFRLTIGKPQVGGGAAPIGGGFYPDVPRRIASAVAEPAEKGAGVVFDGLAEKEVEVIKVPVGTIAPVFPPEDPAKVRARMEALEKWAEYEETRKIAAVDPEKVQETLNYWARIEAQKAAAKKEEDALLARLGKFIVQPVPRDYKVYFATNRPYFKMEKEPWDVYRFIAGLNPLYGPIESGAYIGHCKIHFPGRDRKPGMVASKNGDTIRIEGIDHFKEMKDLLDELWTKDVLVYIHGFNVSFDEAVQTAAQLKEDILFSGAVLVFSWPSYSLPGAYFEDQKMNESDKTVQAAASILSALLNGEPWKTETRGKRGRRHLLAHSMGNRLALNAIESILKSKDRGLKTKLSAVREVLNPTKFDQLVFAAPDVPRDRFFEVASQIKANDFANRMTLYYSGKDVPVRLSEWVHLNNRAGARPVFIDGLDTINADRINSKFGAFTFGHSYYAGADKVLGDIGQLIRHGLSIESRMPPLRLLEKVEGNHKHYAFF